MCYISQGDYTLTNNYTHCLIKNLKEYSMKTLIRLIVSQGNTWKHLPHQSNFQTGRKKIFMMISSHLEDLGVKLLIEMLQKASL